MAHRAASSLPVDWNWKTPPLCPYCTVDLSHRKTPLRRSKFRCKDCDKAIHVDPKQFIYTTPYLDEYRSALTSFLDVMGSNVSLCGDRDQYIQAYHDLKVQFGSKPKTEDVIWRLLNESMIKATYDFEQSMLKAGSDYELRMIKSSFTKYEQKWIMDHQHQFQKITATKKWVDFSHGAF